jgi:predicted nucleic acid-binding protein
MGLIRVFFDTNLFIYLIEGHGRNKDRALELVEGIADRGYEIVTSTLALGEILVHPLQERNLDLLSRYQDLLQPPAVTLIDLDRAAAMHFAAIRRDRTIKSPDAIQLACAAAAKCDLFITNDERLSEKIVPGIHFITSMERAWL